MIPLEQYKGQCIFWAKFAHDPNEPFYQDGSPIAPESLPLAAHCLDVALVFRALCGLEAIRRVLIHVSGKPLSEMQLDRLAILAGMHDLGKANLGFQFKVFNPRSPKAGHVRELAPILDNEAFDEDLRNKFVQALPSGILDWCQTEESAYSYLLATFSHHGRPLRFHGETTGTYRQARDQWWRPDGAWDPFIAMVDVVTWLTAAFPVALEPGGPILPSEPRFHHRFAGLVTLADWLGSHPGWFPIRHVGTSERQYWDEKVIPQLLRTVGLDVSDLRPVLAKGPADFISRFAIPSPTSAQTWIDRIDPETPGMELLILESETGSGKTEAALNWFYKLFVAGKVDSLYFALPSRVAARELHQRVKQVIARWFPDRTLRPVTVLAVPRYSMSQDGDEGGALPSEDNLWQDDEVLRRRDRLWSAERPKRFLAATIAVGTVDQALLSIVQTSHSHLRSVSLDRSLLVVDEVHSSDWYMGRLLENLLRHHLSVGSYAMLLSATLGARAREQYVAAAQNRRAAVPDRKRAQQVAYPAITTGDGVAHSMAVSTGSKYVHFDCLPFAQNSSQTVGTLVSALKAGARVLVVMNTVARSLDMLRALETHPEVESRWIFQCLGVACPHHGRFAPVDRLVLDAEVSARLGKKGSSDPVVLVGTQTLEQSLDIDADLMVTDLAPADVLLQRVGRLHRHPRQRAPGLEGARCLVLVPEHGLEMALTAKGEVLPAFKRMGYGSVYPDLRTLEVTRQALVATPNVSIPDDNRRLVEESTHPESLARLDSDRWVIHRNTLEGRAMADQLAAGTMAAVYDQYFGTFEFNEDGEKVSVRLHADSLQLPLNRPVITPFRQTMREIIMPGHLAPPRSENVTSVIVEDHRGDGTVLLRCASRCYQYSRYGLEVRS